MLRDWGKVKRLAAPVMLWHSVPMSKKPSQQKADRLAEALRANLRRRKIPKAEATKPGDADRKQPPVKDDGGPPSAV
ncbi:hypothetical protein ACFOWX_03775 [Sphingorhabdus arenilitoris]|uniref:Uncharacterized protein n=1 Tax=Sphingorhabdus arenilitoris TaxID=1490041 RepID=A0ABV8RDP1_9SPHN